MCNIVAYHRPLSDHDPGDIHGVAAECMQNNSEMAVEVGTAIKTKNIESLSSASWSRELFFLKQLMTNDSAGIRISTGNRKN